MKKNLLFFVLTLLSSLSLFAQQENNFFFNVLNPLSIYASYGPDEISYAEGWSPSVTASIVGELVYAPVGTTDFEHSLCEPSDEDYTGKFVLVQRGGCFFSDKVYWAEENGAVGVIIISVNGVIPMAGGGDYVELVGIPVVQIPSEIGQVLISNLAAGEVIVEFSPDAAAMAHTVGNVGIDSNGDCISGADELDLAGWKVTVSNDEVYRLDFTDNEGNYDVTSYIGTYNVSVEAPNDIWAICDNEQTVSYSDFTEQEVNFAAAATVECTQLSANLVAPFWRRCFENQVVINYCNTGSITAEDTYVTLDLPDVISVLLTSVPYTFNDEGLYVFETGNVGIGECGVITLLAEVSCDADLGDVLCVEINGHPNAPCVNPTSNWTGASIVADSNCGDEITLSLTNVGTGDMSAPATYRIYKNADLIDESTYQLTAGNTQTFAYLIDGSTYRIEAEAEATQPFTTSASSTISACGQTDVPNDFALQFATADYGQSHEELCLEVIGAYDPNDKNADPRGYGDAHFIDQNTSLKYFIRFQNTGTDTAFEVIVLDTLSEYFDMTSLQLGATSHSYDLRIIDNNILEFKFADIQLVDSFTNEPGSHGFFAYSLMQKVDVPLGSIIENSAAIYFDFNEPVITNETFHQVGRDFTNSVLVNNLITLNGEVTFIPAPLAAQTTVVVHVEKLETGLLEVYNVQGKLVLTQEFDNPQFTIQTRNLPNGAYFYRTWINGVLYGSGKVIK